MIDTQSFAAQIERDGFAVVEQVFESAEVSAIGAAIAREPLSRSRAGARHAMQSAVVTELARAPRLMARTDVAS